MSIGFVLAGSSTFAPPASASPASTFGFVRDFGPVRFSVMIPDDRRGLLFATENLVDGIGVTLRLQVFDDRLQRIGSLDVANAATGTGFAQDPVVYALDERARVLHLVVWRNLRQRESAADPHLLTINLSDRRHPVVVSDRSLAAFPAGTRPLGMSLLEDGAQQAAYFVGQMPSRTDVTVRAHGAYVAEVRDAAAAPVVTASRLAHVPNCQRVIADTRQAVVQRVGEAIWLACGPTTLSENSTPAPSSVQAIDLSDPARSRSYFLPGTYGKGESFFDPHAGRLGRVVIAGSAALRPGQAVWVFDVAHRTFVGQVAGDDINGVGIDPAHGRIFVASANRVLVGSDRGEPLPQALPPIQVFRSVPGAITVVPLKRWVIIPSERSVGTPSFYAVYEDRTTTSDLPEGSLTDFGVQDAETTPLDAPNFTGGTQAFGMRLRLIGGATNVQVNRLGGPKTFWYDPIRGLAPSPHDATGMEDGDRDFYLARVTDAELSADAASAGAIAADRDDRTTVDYRNKVGGWPAGSARCRDFGDGASTDKGKNDSWASGWAAPLAACDLAAGKTEATAESEAARVQGVISIGYSESHVTLTRLPNGGLRGVAHAEARDVVVGGIVHIGRIASDAVVEAFGGRLARAGRTKGTAYATYTRTFEHVAARGPNVPGGEFSCAHATEGAPQARGVCDVTDVAELLTAVLGTTFQVELPSWEKMATRGGAHSHVWRDPWGLIQDSLMNGQLITETQVPAIRISYVADGDVPSRVLIDLAATKADATSIAFADAEVPAETKPTLDVVGPSPALSPATPAPFEPPTRDVPGALPGRRRVVETGWGLVLGNSASGYLLSTGLWALFLAPLFLALRRRSLRTVARIGMPR